MRRDPHAEWSGSVVSYIAAVTGVFYQSNVGADGSTICVQLVGNSPWWRSSDCHLCSLQQVAALAGHSVGDDAVGCSGFLLALLLGSGGVVSCSVYCSCVVSFASACDEQLLSS
jgi:hypothetical protein